MAKPGFWRNLGGGLVNTLLSPGTTPYGKNGQYNPTLLRNGFINLAAGAVNPLAGQAAQFATNRWGGGATQEAGQKAWGWLADQAISPINTSLAPSFPLANLNPGDITMPQPDTGVPTSDMPPVTSLGQPQQLAQLMFGQQPRRDTRSGTSAGSSVLAQGQAAQDMVGDMQQAAWLNMRSPYKFKGMN